MVKIVGYAAIISALFSFITGVFLRNIHWQNRLILFASIGFVGCLVFGSLINICDGIIFCLRKQSLFAFVAFAWTSLLLVLSVICFMVVADLRRRGF